VSYRAGSMTLQLVRPDITQSCSLLAAVRSCASHTPTASRTTAMTSPAMAPRRLSPPSDSLIVCNGRCEIAGPNGRFYHADLAVQPPRCGHGASLRTLCATAPVSGRGVLLQEVQTNAVLVHCHSAPSAALEIGFGDATATQSKAAAPVSVTAAPRNVFLVVHHMRVIFAGSSLRRADHRSKPCILL
jgi:hypothetical protein